MARVLQLHPKKEIIFKEANCPLPRALSNGKARIPMREIYNIPAMLASRIIAMIGIRTRKPNHERIVFYVHTETDPSVSGDLSL